MFLIDIKKFFYVVIVTDEDLKRFHLIASSENISSSQSVFLLWTSWWNAAMLILADYIYDFIKYNLIMTLSLINY